METQKIDLRSVLDATLEELSEWIPSQSACDSPVSAYMRVLASYLTGDIEKLKSGIAALPEGHPLTVISGLRLEVRTHSVTPETLARVLEKAKEFGPISGEAYFVAGLAYETMNDPVKTREAYGLAFDHLEKAGMKRKAVKALLSYVAAESRVFPEKMLISDYFFVYKRALKRRVPSAAGVAMLNISREYQRLEAFSAALKYANRAIALLQHEMGTRPYYLAVAHRCHLFLRLGRPMEARLDYECLKASAIPEIIGAAEVLSPHFQDPTESPAPVSVRALTPSWRERAAELSEDSPAPSQVRSKGLEEKLIQLLSTGKKDKFELMRELYGERLELSITENRLNNLLNRLRKKRPGLIFFHDGKYGLSECVFLNPGFREAIS